VRARALPPEGPSDRAPQREQRANRRVRQGDSLGEHGAQVGQREPAPAAGQVDGPGIVKRHAREECVDTELKSVLFVGGDPHGSPFGEHSIRETQRR